MKVLMGSILVIMVLWSFAMLFGLAVIYSRYKPTTPSPCNPTILSPETIQEAPDMTRPACWHYWGLEL